MSARSPRPGQGPREEGWENLALGGLLLVLGSAVILWAAGELSGFLSSGQRPGASFGHMGEVIVKLFKNLDNPKRSWPRGVRQAMPGPVLFYGVLLLIVAAVTGLALSIARVFKGTFSDGKSGSAWASVRDLRSLVVKAPMRGRLVLGRVQGKLVAAERSQSIIVLGPTQSMKTSGFAIPAILEWEGPVLATSVKSDLLRHTIEARKQRGEVWVYDPTESVTEERSGWSPLDSCRTWHGAQRTASWLCGAAPTGRGLADAEFWYAAAAKLLGPLLYAAARSERTIADVVRWVNLQEQKEVIAALAGGESGALDAARASFGRDIRQKSSIYTTAETVLAAYEDPVVSRSAQVSHISARSFLAEGSEKTLYVVAPSHEQQRLRPLFTTLLHTIISAAIDLSNDMGQPLDPPLLVVLDEAANIAPLRDLDTLASTAASHGIQLVSIFQDLAQIATRYQERFQTVVNNHRGKVFMSGVSDTQTLEYASRLLGDEEVLQASVTRGAYGNRSTTESTALRSVAPANVLRGIRPGEGVLVYGHLPPTRITLRPWFKEKKAKSRDVSR